MALGLLGTARECRRNGVDSHSINTNFLGFDQMGFLSSPEAMNLLFWFLEGLCLFIYLFIFFKPGFKRRPKTLIDNSLESSHQLPTRTNRVYYLSLCLCKKARSLICINEVIKRAHKHGPWMSVFKCLQGLSLFPDHWLSLLSYQNELKWMALSFSIWLFFFIMQ